MINQKPTTARGGAHEPKPPSGLPLKPRSRKSMRAYAEELIQRVNYTDEDGRPIGFDYGYIRRAVLKRFPVVLYNGPHLGKPTKIPFKEIQEYACDLNARGVKLPFRPRRKADCRPNSPASNHTRYARWRARKLGLPDPFPNRPDLRLKTGPRPWLRCEPRDPAHAAMLARRRAQAAVIRDRARALSEAEIGPNGEIPDHFPDHEPGRLMVNGDSAPGRDPPLESRLAARPVGAENAAPGCQTAQKTEGP